jgi:cyclopropane fatty-acyl-phospholipid synthase-like methyltransferase
MATVYMKALEKKAEKYDSGIRTLTRGRLPIIKNYIAENLIKKGERLLDIGAGTGTFAIAAAKIGAIVTGIDASDKMLAVAKKNLISSGIHDNITLLHIPIVELEDQFTTGSFDKITATLIFSELYPKEQEFCLKQIHKLLVDNGEFILVDEVRPKSIWKRILFFFVRIPLVIATYFKAQVTTHPFSNMIDLVKANDFEILEEKCYLFDSLKLVRLCKAGIQR